MRDQRDVCVSSSVEGTRNGVVFGRINSRDRVSANTNTRQSNNDLFEDVRDLKPWHI